MSEDMKRTSEARRSTRDKNGYHIHACLGRRRENDDIQNEEEAEVYTKIEKKEEEEKEKAGEEDGVKMESEECSNGITPQQIRNRDEWIWSYQENKIRMAAVGDMYEDIVRAALAGWTELCLRASIHNKTLQSFTIPKEGVWNIKSPEVDSTSGEIYPDDAPSRLTPAECLRDGNSLYRAISAQLYGCEDHHVEIRLRVALDLIDNWQDYLYGNTLQEMSSHNVDGLVESVIQMSVLGQETDTEQAMQDIIYQTLVPETHASILHLYAASNAIHRHVESIYPNVPNTALNRDLLHQSIKSFTPRTDEPLHVMWTHTLNTYLDATWTPNHFVPCLEFGSDTELETESESYTSSQTWSFVYDIDIINRI